METTNTTCRSIDLRGRTLRGQQNNRYRFGDVRLQGGATPRVHTGSGRDTRRDVFQNRRDYIWDNPSDTATLRDEHGRTVDTESWGHHRRYGADTHVRRGRGADVALRLLGPGT
ncbi:lamin tail domain-containing protein [Streptomyces sp. NPDC127106]|uniref:lamin tail domain-containing protein n=1 Tax=Streptomyces sp. NPDC127106 TaxID=3345360 RepID=UPI003633574D